MPAGGVHRWDSGRLDSGSALGGCGELLRPSGIADTCAQMSLRIEVINFMVIVGKKKWISSIARWMGICAEI